MHMFSMLITSMQSFKLIACRDFPRPNLGPVIGPCFVPNRDRNFIINFPVSSFVLHFGENCMKIGPKITKLQLITFRSMVGFDKYF